MRKKSVTMIDAEKAASWAKKYANLKPIQEPQTLSIKMFFGRHYDAIKNLIDGGHGLKPVYNDLISEGLIGADESNGLKTLKRIWTQVSNEIAGEAVVAQDDNQALPSPQKSGKKKHGKPAESLSAKPEKSGTEPDQWTYTPPLSDKI